MHKFELPQSLVDRAIARMGNAYTCQDFEPAKTALVVVDMQNFFMEDGQPACAPEAREIVPNVNRLAAAVRNAGGLVVWIQTLAPVTWVHNWRSSAERYDQAKRDARSTLLKPGSHAFELWAGLDVRPDDARVIKRRYSAFIPGSSDIEIALEDRGIDTVLITGVATNVCCESTARDAQMRNYRTLMVSDGCASFTDEEHEASLKTFYLYFGDVQTTEQVAAKFEAKAKNSLAAE